MIREDLAGEYGEEEELLATEGSLAISVGVEHPVAPLGVDVAVDAFVLELDGVRGIPFS